MKGQVHKIYLHTGSNQGQRVNNLEQAVQQIDQRIGKINQRSDYYETEAWGETDQPDFINQALEVFTKMSPKEVLQEIQLIELELGRVRTKRWAERIIDIDLLFYENQIIDLPDLKVPHTSLHLRNFVLIPMMEISAEFIHPVFKLSIEELYLQSRDELEVRLMGK